MGIIGANHISICDYSMHLFYEAGHIDTTTPLFENHPSSQFVYFDCADDISITYDQSIMLNSFDNVSLLFKLDQASGCFNYSENETIKYLSVELDCTGTNRSQLAYEIHRLIHSITLEEYTVILFMEGTDVLLSFASDYGQYVMSDWYDADEDYYAIIERINIVNISLNSAHEFFSDFAYTSARENYFHPKTDEFDAFLALGEFLDPRDQFLFRKKTGPQLRDLFQLEYENDEDDYFDFSNTEIDRYSDAGSALDLMWLELENDIATENELLEEKVTDDFEYSNIDESVFDNAEMLLAYLDQEN